MNRLLLPFLLLHCVNTLLGNPTQQKTRVSRQSELMAEAIRNEDPDKLADLFIKDGYILPEYHPTLQNSRLIKSYYEAFFKKTQTLHHRKKPFEIKALDQDYYIELGTFEHRYIAPSGDTFDCNGKYMTFWIVSKSKEPRVVAHIWGSSSYFDTEMVDILHISTPPLNSIQPTTDWEHMIEERRIFAYPAILKRDTESQLVTYHQDAIYMTYYDPPFIGKDQIAAYYRSHNNPDLPLDSLDTRIVRVIELGKYALQFGEYYVSWTWDGKQYFIQGKGLALYKKMDQGPIQIYRQMINHSMPATLFAETDSYFVRRILKHLDNQDLELEDYLTVYADENLMIYPPDRQPIAGKTEFALHLDEERNKYSMEINHQLNHLESYEDFVIAAGSSRGQVLGDELSNSFQTKNMMLFKRQKNGQLKINWLIWNLTM